MSLEEPKVIKIVDDWFLGADSYCFILYRRRRVRGGGNGGQPKQENVGKYSYTAVGYFTTIGAMLKSLVTSELREAINKEEVKTLEDLWAEVDALISRMQRIDESLTSATFMKVFGNE